MSATRLDLFVDLTTRRLVASTLDGRTADLPVFYREDQVQLRVYVKQRKQTGSLREFYETVDVSGLSLRVAIGDRHGATPGPIALQTTWTKDTAGGYFEGSLNLNTQEVDGRIRDSVTGEIASTFEITIVESGNHNTVVQRACTIRGDVNRVSSVAPVSLGDASAFGDDLEAALANTAGVDGIEWTRVGDQMEARLATSHPAASAVSASQIDSLVPAMTADSEGGYTVSASHADTGGDAYKAFDGSSATRWFTPTRDTGAGQTQTWLQVQLPAADVIRGWRITHPSADTLDDTQVKFQGSNDGSTWQDLDTVESGSVTLNEAVPSGNEDAYLYYRLLFTKDPVGTYTMEVYELTLFDALPTVQMTIGASTQTVRGDVIIDPAGDLEKGKDGLRLRRPMLGRAIYSSTAPTIESINDLWVDTSRADGVLDVWGVSPTTGAWQRITERLIYSGEAEPSRDDDPFVLWHVPSAPQLNIWDGTNQTWKRIADIVAGGAAVGTLPTPVISPSGGEQPATVTITIPGDSGADIYYTTDGSTPDATDTLYSTPIAVASAITIKAIAIKAGWTSSAVASAAFTAPTQDDWRMNLNLLTLGFQSYPVKDGPAAAGEFDDDWATRFIATTGSTQYFDLAPIVTTGGNLVSVRFGVPRTYLTTDVLTGHPDAMMLQLWKRTPAATVQDFLVTLTNLPLGVYDLYVYAHGRLAAENTICYAVDYYGQRASKSTSSVGANYLTNAWNDGDQYVSFLNLELVNPTALNSQSLILGILKNGGSQHINGIQLIKKAKWPKPCAIPGDGSEFVGSTTVQLKVPGHSQVGILYTTDGSNPSGTIASPGGTSSAYSSPVAISATTTIKALATVDGSSVANSEIASFTITKQ